MLNLQEKIYEKMNILCNCKKQIIYKNCQNSNKDSIETLTIIVAMPHNRFRIYKAINYKNDVSIEYFTIEEDMFKAMVGEVEDND